jgi:hypothetical protein
MIRGLILALIFALFLGATNLKAGSKSQESMWHCTAIVKGEEVIGIASTLPKAVSRARRDCQSLKKGFCVVPPENCKLITIQIEGETAQQYSNHLNDVYNEQFDKEFRHNLR